MNRKQKILVLAAVLLLSAQRVIAQSGLNKAKSALDTATQQISGIFDAAYKIILAIAAIVAVIGAIQVYAKWNSGDPNATKLAGAWFGSALFLVGVGIFIKAMFL